MSFALLESKLKTNPFGRFKCPFLIIKLIKLNALINLFLGFVGAVNLIP